MLTDQKFNQINQTFSNYSEILRRHKSHSKHRTLLAICTYLTVLVSLVSIVVLYHYHGFFRPIFNGKYKLFTANVPMPFSIALIVVIPSLILLCFLIYKMCKGQTLNNQLVDDTNLFMSSVMEVCQLLKDELNTSKQNLSIMMSSYECLEHKHDILARQCSAGLDTLNAELARLDLSLSQTTATMGNKLVVLQNMVTDIKQRMLQLSVCHSHVREMENRLYECISNSLRVSHANLEQKMQLLKELRIDLSSPLASLDGLKCSMQVITHCIEHEIPKPEIFLRFNKLYNCVWKLQTTLLSALSKVGTFHVDSGAALSLVQMLDEFLNIFNEKIKGHSGNDLSKLQELNVHVQLLQIRLLRFLVQQRSTMLTDACNATAEFIEGCSTEVARVSDNVVDPTESESVVGAELLNVSGDSATVDLDVSGLSSVGADSKGAIGSAHP